MPSNTATTATTPSLPGSTAATKTSQYPIPTPIDLSKETDAVLLLVSQNPISHLISAGFLQPTADERTAFAIHIARQLRERFPKEAVSTPVDLSEAEYSVVVLAAQNPHAFLRKACGPFQSVQTERAFNEHLREQLYLRKLAIAASSGASSVDDK